MRRYLLPFVIAIALLTYGGYKVVGMLGQFTFEQDVLDTSVSPDKKLVAVLFLNDCGATAHSYSVCIRPNNQSSQNNSTIASAGTAVFETLRWTSNTTLHLKVDSVSELVTKENTWQSVHIEYETESKFTK